MTWIGWQMAWFADWEYELTGNPAICWGFDIDVEIEGFCGQVLLVGVGKR
jgi:hypothetical protein